MIRAHCSPAPDTRLRKLGILLSIAVTIERYRLKLNRDSALASRLSMIFSENRFPLFRIMLERDGNDGGPA